MKKLLFVACFTPSTAWAAGAFGTLGLVATPAYELVPSTGSKISLDPFYGPAVRVGWEIGNHWNHEFALQWTMAFTQGTYGDIDLDLNFSTYAFGYRFSWEALGKKGFTPLLGVGLSTGYALINATASQGDQTGFQDGGTFYLEFNAAVGARYTMESGLNFRAEVVGSTYGGFLALQPGLGVGYQF